MAYGNNGRRAASLFNEQRDSEPASGFLNLYVRTKTGGESKIGFIVLNNKGVAQRQLIEAIEAQKGDQEMIAKIVSTLIVKYNSAESDVQIDVGV